ncbi:MAG: hypothetical protein OHK0021_09910 [Bryobacter sp.]
MIKRRNFLLSATAAFATTARAQGLSPRYRLGFAGLGPLYFGMPEAQIAERFGEALEEAEAPGEACHARRFATSGASPLTGLVLIIRNGRLARLDVDTPDWQTQSGARVRMPEGELRKIYGRRLREEPHPIDVTGRLLLLSAREANLRHLAIVFESDGDRVTRIRAGLAKDLTRLEECP